jgi:hypothetical protein
MSKRNTIDAVSRFQALSCTENSRDALAQRVLKGVGAESDVG